MRRHFEQHIAVCRRQRFIKTVVDFILAAGILMVDLLQVKAQPGQGLAHVIEKTQLTVNGFQIVRRLVQPIVLIGPKPAALSVLAQQEKFGLDANPQRPTPRVETLQLVLEKLTRTGCQGLACGIAVTNGMGDTGHKRQRPQGCQLHPAVIFAACTKTPQAGADNARAGKTGTLFHPLLQVVHRYQFAFGNPVQIAKLGQY
ncbi:hypothetical protein GALL_450350 [mine drainage metagenome]|uniref:Uncharacterized protein n=1 Tax=mine drainage metagenome TaxID=410659 RepID=A0A1J5PRB3_9ZZZZ